MAKFYCFNCGYGTDYTLNKPKVCLKCNQSFITSSVVISKLPVQQIKGISQIKIIEPESNNLELLDINFIPEVENKSFASIDVERNCNTVSGSQILTENKNKLSTSSAKRGRKPKIKS